MNRPLIAITAFHSYSKGDEKAALVGAREQYFQAIEQAGGLGLLLLNTQNTKVLDQTAEVFDGLLLTGGGDIDPSLYNKESIKESEELNQTVNKDRDFTEQYLINKFRELDKPILGICRGCQIINVTYGGDLIQHLADSSEVHFMSKEAGHWYVDAHDIKINKDSKLSSMTDESQLAVNSAHHQSVNTPGQGLKISAKSSKGVVESVEDAGAKFILGVQWHPEQQLEKNLNQKLFKAFIDACKY